MWAPFNPWASCVVTNAAAPATGPVEINCAVSDGGAGIYDYALVAGAALDANQSIVLVEPRTVDLTFLVTHTSDVAKVVTFADLCGGDTDALHAVMFCQINPGVAP